jgi:tagatose-6-phosphate ketose/aldose isomerase
LPNFGDNGLLISLGRSGDSPESVAVVKRIQHLYPNAAHLAITCNADGQLAHTPRVRSIVLDARTNDRSLAMTSSFSNLVLAGLCLRFGAEIEGFLPALCAVVERRLPELDALAERLSPDTTPRAVILASGALRPLATETALKILEMTAGRTATLAETFLGLRHGPMSFLTPDTLVLCFLSSAPDRRRYEQDLLAELRHKRLGRIVGVVPVSADRDLFDECIPASSGHIRDELRVPFEIPFAQLLAYHLSLREGLDPDNPSPLGAITRVVQKFVIYDDEPHV